MEKWFILAVAMMGSVVGAAAQARAGLITYNIQDQPDYPSKAALSGTITTDGVMGMVAQSDILAWSVTINGTTFTSTDSGASTVLRGSSDGDFPAGSGIMASATQLTLQSPALTDVWLYLFGNANYDTYLFWVSSAPEVEDMHGNLTWGASLNGAWVWVAREDVSDHRGTIQPTWVIATATSVPEPSTLAGAGIAGLFGLAYAGRRRRA